MPDIDPNAIPFVPDTTVALIDTANGRPKTAFHDWMQSLYSWMKESVVDLTTKVTTLIDTVANNTASIVAEQIARVTADDALAGQITTISAAFDDATADGEIYFAAKATPTGSTAAYGLYLTAGDAFSGLEVISDSVLGSAIGLTANQFAFVDSGTAEQVFSYSGGVFYFNIPIVLQSGASGERMVLSNQRIDVYDSSDVLRVRVGIL